MHENTDIGWHWTGQCRSGNCWFRSASAPAGTSFNPSWIGLFGDGGTCGKGRIKKIVGGGGAYCSGCRA
jgi:hypothetical protein